MIVKKHTNVVQANHLIENRPNFTKDETRLFLTIIGAINKDDDDFKPFKIPVTEFADLWGIDSKNAYSSIKTALRGLRKKEFFIEGVNTETGKRRFITSSSISTAIYEEGEGYATIEVSSLFKPYLLALKEKYTSYVLKNIMDLSTTTTIRIYELLKQYQTAGKRAFEIDDFRKLLYIEGKYPDNTDLRRYVIEPCVAEINKKTDIFVSYEILGRGKKAKIDFKIKKQKIDASAVTGTTLSKEKNKINFVDENGVERILELEYNQMLEFENGEFKIVTRSDEEIQNELELMREYEQEQIEGQITIEEALSLEDKELQDLKNTLKRGSELTEAQLFDINNTLKNCQYIQNMMFYTINSFERTRLKKEYIQAQESYTLARMKHSSTESYFSYLDGAIRDNYKKVSGWWDNKEASSEKPSYDMDEFNRRADKMPVYKG